ncbi:MAG: hypothetical protein JJE46_01065 [Acidimicrobiia bacterium]|nr:hypothetical protein [Acidimicrobiia bacterium]
MAYLITHFFEGGTADQYQAVIGAAHPADGSLPAGQTYHAAGPTEGGWLVVAVWDSREVCDSFVHDTLIPTLQKTEDGFAGPPEERSSEVANLVVG